MNFAAPYKLLEVKDQNTGWSNSTDNPWPWPVLAGGVT